MTQAVGAPPICAIIACVRIRPMEEEEEARAPQVTGYLRRSLSTSRSHGVGTVKGSTPQGVTRAVRARRR